MKLTRHNRRGFTLVELLVVISILAMLSSMLLGALYAAQESARHTKTKTTIDKIQGIILLHWDGYQTRRVPVRMTQAERTSNTGIRSFALRQLRARWQLQRIELPDRYEDISFEIYPDSADNFAFLEVDTSDANKPSRRTLSANSLRAAYRAAITSVGYDPTDNDDMLPISSENQSAECLYLVVAAGLNADADVRFLESEIGDTDGDGMPEFLDGWGRPIGFIRWPSGVDSAIQKDTTPDPFDPMQVTQVLEGRPGHILVPLVTSGGPDGEVALNLVPLDGSPAELTPGNRERRPFDDQHFNRGAPLDPEDVLEGGGPEDNIHNHFVEISK